jgi:hypothetical protein
MFFILFLGSAEKVPKFQEVFVICEGWVLCSIKLHFTWACIGVLILQSTSHLNSFYFKCAILGEGGCECFLFFFRTMGCCFWLLESCHLIN